MVTGIGKNHDLGVHGGGSGAAPGRCVQLEPRTVTLFGNGVFADGAEVIVLYEGGPESNRGPRVGQWRQIWADVAIGRGTLG